MFSKEYQKVLRQNMILFLKEEGMLPNDFDLFKELILLLNKKTIFPYKDINANNLNHIYESCQPSNVLLTNF